VLKAVQNYVWSPFERSICEDGMNLEVLIESGQIKKVLVDDYYDWLTVILVLNEPNDQFIAFHTYRDRSFFEIFLMEGQAIQGKGIILDRFYMQNRDGTYNHHDAYLDASIHRNRMAPNFLEEVFHLPMGSPMVQHGRRTWAHAEKVKDWFRNQERVFLNIAMRRYEAMELDI
jgi:hypothetical protein